VIAMVRRTFRNLDIADIRLIYKTYIRPHMEFCIQAWSPHFDIDVLERVQKRQQICYQCCGSIVMSLLQMIGVTSLEESRLRGDMIEVYKLLTGKE